MTTDPKELAIAFVRKYAEEHEFFTSSEVCDAYKAHGGPAPDNGKGWRDVWGGVMAKSHTMGVLLKAGKSAPKGTSTHMSSTVLWQSRVFKGEPAMVEVGASQLRALRHSWVTNGHKDLMALLWDAYEIGFSQGQISKQPTTYEAKL
jgi:hypothetical protein